VSSLLKLNVVVTSWLLVVAPWFSANSNCL